MHILEYMICAASCVYMYRHVRMHTSMHISVYDIRSEGGGGSSESPGSGADKEQKGIPFLKVLFFSLVRKAYILKKFSVWCLYSVI